jgi:hypothetical protein
VEGEQSILSAAISVASVALSPVITPEPQSTSLIDGR